MKRRRLLAAVMTSTLAVAQMATPVMAATGSGSLNVSVQNTDTVLRVQVPTALTVAVDEFETAKDGSQISSAAFTMINKSAVPVSVAVESEVTLGSGIALAESATEIDNTASELWLAVAAQTEAGKYGVATVGDLTADSANVVTFDKTTRKAAQTFYLAEGTGTISYKLLEVTTAGEVGEGDSFGEYYKLTKLDATVFDGTDDDAALQGKIAAGDVYMVKTADIANGVLTKIAKAASSTATYDSDYTYYSVATSTTALTSIPTGEYVYAEMSGAATTGGTAAFRYIGKLSTKQSWDNTNVTTIGIAYTITGVPGSAYDVAKDDCVYGLYTAPVAPSIDKSSYALVADTPLVIELDRGAGSKIATSFKVLYNGNDMKAAGFATYDAVTSKITISAAGVAILMGKDDPGSIDIVLNEGKANEVTITAALTK